MIQRALKHSARSLACVALVSLVQGCQTITEKLTEKAVEAAIETQTGGDVDIKAGEGVTFKSKDSKGEEVVIQSQTGKIPDAWPKDIPAYPGAKVNASLMSGKNGMLMLETTDPSEKVLAFYKSSLSGMKEHAIMNAGPTSILTLQEEKGGRELGIGATAQDGKTMIHIQLSEKDK